MIHVTHPNNMHVVLIGVDKYTHYDESGSLDLPGSVNDARTWWRIVRALGVPPQNVRVLVSPVPSDLQSAFPGADPTLVHEATNHNITQSCKWLNGSMHSGNVPGLLTYSGHGDIATAQLVGASELALCPSDVTKGGKNILTFGDLERLFDSESAQNLTTVLDCCFAGGAAQQEHPLSINTRTWNRDSRPISFSSAPFGGRLLLACQVNEVAYQGMFMGEYHGAFTWALTSEILQWATSEQGSSRCLHLSYAKARSVAEKLLCTLYYKQEPLLAPHKPSLGGIDDLALFQTGHAPGYVHEIPDGNRTHIQLDPSTKTSGYRVYAWKYNSTVIARVMVPIQDHTYAGRTYTQGQEYWFLAGTTTLQPTSFAWSDVETWPTEDPMSGFTFHFQNPQSPTWSSGGTASQSNLIQLGTAGLYVVWGLTYQSQSGNWTGSLLWLTPSAQTRFLSNTATGIVTLSANATTPSSYSSYVGGF